MGALSRASARLFYELLRRAKRKGRVNLKSEIELSRCGTYVSLEFTSYAVYYGIHG